MIRAGGDIHFNLPLPVLKTIYLFYHMKLSFVKTLEGHEIEFVRLLYPLRYDVYLRKLQANPIKMTCRPDDNGAWSIDNPSELPGWVMELTLQIQEKIEENEAAAGDE